MKKYKCEINPRKKIPGLNIKQKFVGELQYSDIKHCVCNYAKTFLLSKDNKKFEVSKASSLDDVIKELEIYEKLKEQPKEPVILNEEKEESIPEEKSDEVNDNDIEPEQQVEEIDEDYHAEIPSDISVDSSVSQNDEKIESYQNDTASLYADNRTSNPNAYKPKNNKNRHRR